MMMTVYHIGGGPNVPTESELEFLYNSLAREVGQHAAEVVTKDAPHIYAEAVRGRVTIGRSQLLSIADEHIRRLDAARTRRDFRRANMFFNLAWRIRRRRVFRVGKGWRR